MSQQKDEYLLKRDVQMFVASCEIEMDRSRMFSQVDLPTSD